MTMKVPVAIALLSLAAIYAQPSGDPTIEGFRLVEVASVADAMEQLYGQRAYMSHEMRPLFMAKFAGPAGAVLMEQEGDKGGGPSSHGVVGGLDRAGAGGGFCRCSGGVADCTRLDRLLGPPT